MSETIVLPTKSKSPLKSRPFTRAGRLNDALSEIELALATFETDATASDQLADLADALDAFAERNYGVAAALARAATRPRRKLSDHRRPESMAQTIAELRQDFARMRAVASGEPNLVP